MFDPKLSRLVAFMVIGWLGGIFSLVVIAFIDPSPVPIFAILLLTLMIITFGGMSWKKELEEFKSLDINLKSTLSQLEKEKRRILEEKARSDAIILSIGDGIIVTDGDGKISFMNKAAEEMLGWTQEEAFGQNLTSLVPYVDARGKEADFKDRPIMKAIYSAQKITVPATNFYVRKNGTKFPVSMTLTPIKVNKQIVGVIQDFRDDTVERSIDRAKSEFVSLASHQLRTPLSTVNWYTEMLLAGDVGELKSEQKKYLEEVYRSNQRMIDLVNSLLNVSRIELATIAVEPEVTDMTELVKQSLAQFDIYIKAKKLKLKTVFANRLPKVKVDTKLLSIVYDNLISNAISYTPEGGTIRVELYKLNTAMAYTSRVGEAPHASIIFKISDTGYGIPENAKNKIFTKLYRADNIRAKDTTGSGLGLYIAKSIMDYAGGKIWFDSEEGKGTTFYVSIPVTGMRPQTGMKKLT